MCSRALATRYSAGAVAVWLLGKVKLRFSSAIRVLSTSAREAVHLLCWCLQSGSGDLIDSSLHGRRAGSARAGKRARLVTRATGRRLTAHAFMRIAIFATGFRSLPAIVEIQFFGISYRPPASAAAQGKCRYEFRVWHRFFSIHLDETWLTASPGSRAASRMSN